MLFNIEKDAGKVIEGYLVPENFSDRPRIVVTRGEETIGEFDCMEMREAVQASGRHDTGMVGFRLDETLVPGLATLKELAIHDAGSGLLIYRRAPRPWIKKRLVRLECQLIPLVAIDHALQDFFQYGVGRVDRFGAETTLQIFHLNGADSIYLAGRLQIRAFEQFLERGFEAVTVLSEPYYEMAERLFFLKRFSDLPEVIFGPRDRMVLAPAVEHFSEVDLTSMKEIRAALKSLDPATARVLASPLTRQLTTILPDEEIDRRSAAPALDVLSRFSVTGLRERPETFIAPLAELIGIEPVAIPEPRQHARVAELGEMLRDIPLVETLLETDLVIYHFAREAIISNVLEETEQVSV